jgi:hypothetical protein
MNRDDIIRMAREAGAYPAANTDRALLLLSESHLEAFAALVAAHEREATLERNNLTWVANCQHLVAAEREECAKLAEAWGAWIGDGQLFANAIRTRVDKK